MTGSPAQTDLQGHLRAGAAQVAAPSQPLPSLVHDGAPAVAQLKHSNQVL